MSVHRRKPPDGTHPKHSKGDARADEAAPPPARGVMGEFRRDYLKQRAILAEVRARTDWTPRGERWTRLPHSRGASPHGARKGGAS